VLKRKSASPVLHSCNVKTQICVTRPQCVKETGLEVNADKIKLHGHVSRMSQNAGRSHTIKTENSSFERMEEFKIYGNKFYKSKF